MSTPPIGTLVFDDRLDSYDVLMKDPAGETLLDAAQGLAIEQAVTDLAASWRMTDYARNQPHLLVTTINSVAAHASGTTGDSAPVRILGALAAQLDGRLDREALRRVKAAIEKLHQKLRVAGRRIIEEERRGREQLAAEGWRSMLEEPAFVLALAASQAQAYSALYFAYECFLSAAVEVRTGQWPESTGDVGRELRKVFGAKVHARCWSDRQVEAARHARDALAHRGGRVQVNRVLKKDGTVSRWATADFPDLLRVEGGRIQIMASQVRDLYAALFARVLEVIAGQRAFEAAPKTAAS